MLWTARHILLLLLASLTYACANSSESVLNDNSENKARIASDCSADSFAESYFLFRHQPAKAALWPSVSCALTKLSSFEQAYEWQQRYRSYYSVREMQRGYKVALGNKSAQDLLGTPGPVIGYLFADTILQSGAVVSPTTGKNMAVEADLLVTVGSGQINQAETISDVIRHLDSITAMLELPDLMFPLTPASAHEFIATNAGANLLVLGSGVDLAQNGSLKKGDAEQRRTAVLQSLASMKVRLRHGTEELSVVAGDSLMGHPLNAVLYLLAELRSAGQQLQAGDVISLGAFGKPVPLSALSASPPAVNKKRVVTVIYDGLIDHKNNKPISVSAQFTE